MADDPDQVVLILLGRIDERTQRMADDITDLKVRMTAVEEALAGVNRRIHRIEQRIERIERRLDLAEA